MKSVYLFNLMSMDVSSKVFEEKFIGLGANTGNIIFLESLREQISYDAEINITNYMNYKLDDNSLVVVPSSNFIQHNGNDSFYESFISFLNNSKCKICLIGLGAQSSRFYNTPKKLVASLTSIQVEFLRLISQRSVNIGVRGNFTAECLDLLGIHNYTIIGCPSYYKDLDGKFVKPRRPKISTSQITITPSTDGEINLAKLGFKLKSIWVAQTYSEYCDKQGIKLLIYLLKKYHSCFIPRKIRNYLINNHIVFFIKKEWDNFYNEKKIGFAYGTRFHGNMAAYRAGVPALWIVHDSRTKELVEYLCLPHINSSDLVKIKRTGDLVKLINYDITENNYNKLCSKYVEFLDENSILHNFKIEL